MSDAAEQKAKNKGKQNMKYNEAFTNFLVILRSISPRALDLFRQNLEGRGIQSLRVTKAVRTYLLQHSGYAPRSPIKRLPVQYCLAVKLNLIVRTRLGITEVIQDVSFSCSILDGIGPIIRVQDPKYAKKTAQNAIMSGARLLTFGNSSVWFQHFLYL
ncbi:hypothetical protein C2G38_2029110 [Gigaspora rosea]|uniref:Uncharacterized protein n=1 Tax=Gigaspora rosea TaxID=44941 RepID=A0A397W3A8_9GLOM|nr:hypothetical protein C2G38_2029110 [Gigaspora rosea]